MRNRMFTGAALVAGVVIGCCFSRAWATKPSISTDQMVDRAAVILTGRVISSKKLRTPNKDPKGNWLPETRRVRVRIARVLKADLRGEVDVDVPGIVFEKDKSYVFFINPEGVDTKDPLGPRRTLGFDFLPTNTKRLEASSKTVSGIEFILKKRAIEAKRRRVPTPRGQ